MGRKTFAGSERVRVIRVIRVGSLQFTVRPDRGGCPLSGEWRFLASLRSLGMTAGRYLADPENDNQPFPTPTMLYTILCYNSENVVHSWTKEQDDEVMAKLIAVQDRIAKRGRLGPVARLGPTKKAKTLHKDREPFLLTDGPYAETKEQILGFYVIDCDTEDEAVEIARELGHANPGGAFEVRPLIYFQAGELRALSEA